MQSNYVVIINVIKLPTHHSLFTPTIHSLLISTVHQQGVQRRQSSTIDWRPSKKPNTRGAKQEKTQPSYPYPYVTSYQPRKRVNFNLDLIYSPLFHFYTYMLNVFNNSPGCSKHFQDYPFHRETIKTLKIWNYKIMILKVSLPLATINYLMNSRTILKPLGTIRLKPRSLKLQRPKYNITNQKGQKRILPLTNKPSIAGLSIRVALHWHRIWYKYSFFFFCPLTDRPQPSQIKLNKTDSLSLSPSLSVWEIVRGGEWKISPICTVPFGLVFQYQIYPSFWLTFFFFATRKAIVFTFFFLLISLQGQVSVHVQAQLNQIILFHLRLLNTQNKLIHQLMYAY